MRTLGWAMALALATGCTDTVSLDDAGDTGGTGGTGESADDPDTNPPIDGSDDGPPECIDDADCGDPCGWCEQGICLGDVGCCGADAEQPGFWRCSPPPACWDDSECPEGQVCHEWEGCVPDPDAVIRQPAACPDDLVLTVQQLPLAQPLRQVAVHAGEPESLLGVDDMLRLVQVDATSGDITELASLSGVIVRDLVPTGPLSTTVILDQQGEQGEPAHQLVVLAGELPGTLEAGVFHSGVSTDAAGLGESAEAIVAVEGRLDRWSVAPAPVLQGELGVEQPATFVAAVRPAEGEALLLGVSQLDDTMALVDAVTGQRRGSAVSAVGSLRALAAMRDAAVGDGELLVALSAVDLPKSTTGEPMAGLQVVRDHETGTTSEPFGAPGIPLALAVAELDGDGVDDVVVAMEDGRLDVYLMDETDVRCRSFLPLATIEDLAAGDVDGDGAVDIIVTDTAPAVTVIHGVVR